MQNKFNLIIKTPEKEIYNGEVINFYVTTDIGMIGVYANHASLVSTITFSPLLIDAGPKSHEYLLRSGILTFDNKKNECKILAYMVDKSSEIDTSGAQNYLKQIETMLANNESLSEYSIKFLENEKVALVKQLNNSK